MDKKASAQNFYVHERLKKCKIKGLSKKLTNSTDYGKLASIF